MRFLKIISLACSALLFVACSTNPVTGKSELVLVGSDEVALGQQQYQPSIQSQGGEFIHDSALSNYVNRVGQQIARNSDRNLPYEFKIINSSEPNAWALPGGKLAINRGMLLEMSTEAELAAVLGHEIVHAAAGHSRQQMQSSTFLNIGLQLAQAGLQGSGYQDLAMQGASLGAQILNSKYSQSQELEADYYGMNYMSRAGFSPQGAVDIQKTFLRLSQGSGQSGLATLFSSHPPSALRVAKNTEHLATLPNTGNVGASTYQQAIANIKRLQPAYDLYDKGVAAVTKKQYSQALTYVNQAISRFPREGQFYELRGFSQQQLNQTSSALASYNKAIQYNPNYYGGYLRRGILYASQNNRSAAEQDLVKSYRLLPSSQIADLINKVRGVTQ